MARAPLAFRGRNPDVLSCIANLSNEFVFTPPNLANRMLDSLAEAWAESNDGEDIWSNSAVTFLDPCTKTGVYLREIVRRLADGLREEIPDLGVIPREVGDTVTLRPSAVPAVDVAVGHL